MKLRIRALLSLVVVASLLGMAAVAGADMLENLAKTSPQERAGIQTAFMKSKLGLPEAELAKVAAINLKYAEKSDPVIKGSDGPFMKMRQIKGIQAEKDAELKGVLSAPQYQAYEAAREEMKQKFEQAIAKKAQGGG